MLTACEQAAIAADINAIAHPSSAQIQRATTASDGLGGRSRTFATVATVACRITPDRKGAAEAMTGERMMDKEPYRVSFPLGTDVRITDRVVVDGVTLAVEAVQAPRSVEVERVTYCTRAAA